MYIYTVYIYHTHIYIYSVQREGDRETERLFLFQAAEVRILDLLCLMDPSLVTRIFPAVKKAFQFCGKAQRKLASC